MNEKTIIQSNRVNSALVWILPLVVASILAIFFVVAWYVPIWFVVCVIALLGIFFYWWLGKIQLTVTDKRVYGKAIFGKRVDLPLDSISAVGTSILWGIDVGTSSGRIHFKLIKNKDAIHSELGKLLVERQSIETQNRSTSNIDEIKQYKNLLDSGIITQEEFDAKKKQLLEL